MSSTLPQCKINEECMVGGKVFGAQYASPAMGFFVFHLPREDIALDRILSKPCIRDIHVK